MSRSATLLYTFTLHLPGFQEVSRVTCVVKAAATL